MKKYKRLLSLLLVFFMSFTLLAGCALDTDEGGDVFSYSEGIDKNGYWKGIKALDYIEGLNYLEIPVPADVHNVSDDYLQLQIKTIMDGYYSRIQIMDRAVAYGDTVNIDYEGKIDGAVFEGGSTMSVGVEATIEASDDTDKTDRFLDGFLEQLVGHMPGTRFDIEVSFPADYRIEAHRGKDAVFSTTINYIVEKEELTDDFVAKNLSPSSGWTTVEEMRNGLRAGIQKKLVQQYIEEYLMTEVPVKSIPDALMEYQEKTLLHNYQEYADFYGMELEEYLKEYEGFSSVEECIADGYDGLVENATFFLVAQAVAEDVGMSVSDEDLAKYSSEHLWSSDYSLQVEEYGLPYVKQSALCQKVIDYIAENAILL